MRVASIGEICEFKYGASLPDRQRAPGDIPVYGSNGVVGRHTASLTVGPTVVIGRKGSIGKINFSEHSCWPIDTTYFVDSSSTKEDIRWLSYALASIGLESLNKATGVPGLNRNDAYAKLLRVPPLDEQRRIAAILDQADDLRRKRLEAIAKLAKLSTGLFVELFGTPWISSASSSISDLGSISVFENGDRSSNYPSGDDILTSGIPFLSTKNIVDDKLDLGSLLFISPSKFVSLSRGKARPHDLIITLRGTLGNCCIFDGPFSTAFINAQMMIIRAKPDISPVFLHAYLTLPATKEHLQQIGNGAAVPQLTAKQLAGLPIPHPPLDLQRAFAARVAEIDQLKAHHRAHLARLDALFASLQHRAFRGDLRAPSFSRAREKVASRSEVG
ncbi:restriction endonuclease subunit S [Methylosinus sp. LW4]|uniref:restriction endonuclease subunit S n=1 Tax=Methylosinus sp. LW4 TaxID=136993 RepID=UPI000375547F|nr:restriction endonuclease subunit S [Methylosinus sp. LW4]